MVRRSAAALATASLALAFLGGCGGGKGEITPLDLALSFPPGWEERLDMGALSAPGSTPYVGTIRVVVERDGATVASADGAWSSHRVDLGSLPPASDYKVTVKALTRGRVIMAGAREGVTVGQAGAPAPLRLQEVNGFASFASLIYPRQWHAAEMFTVGKILVVGGNSSTPSIEEIVCHSVSGEGFLFSVDLPSPAITVGMANLGNPPKMLIIKGDNGFGHGSFDLIDYGLFSATSVSVHPGSPSRTGYFWGASGGQAYFLGGYESLTWKNDCIKTNCETMAQFSVPGVALTNKRVNYSIGHVLGASIFVGGMEGMTFLPRIDVVSFPGEINLGQFNLSRGKVGATLVEWTGQRLLIFGGNTSLGSSSTVEMLDLSQSSVTSLPPVLTRRHWSKGVLLNSGKVLLVGGGGTEVRPSAELYDPATGECEMVPWKMRVPRIGHTATKLPDGRVVIIGGNMGSREIEVYNPPVDP